MIQFKPIAVHSDPSCHLVGPEGLFPLNPPNPKLPPFLKPFTALWERESTRGERWQLSNWTINKQFSECVCSGIVEDQEEEEEKEGGESVCVGRRGGEEKRKSGALTSFSVCVEQPVEEKE